MYIRHAFLCERAVLKNGKIDVTGLIDQVALSALPATIGYEFPLVTGILWKNVVTSQDVTLRLRTPSGDFKDFIVPALSSQYETQIQVTDLRGVELAEAGSYTFEIIVNGEVYGAIEFEAIVVPRFSEAVV